MLGCRRSWKSPTLLSRFHFSKFVSIEWETEEIALTVRQTGVDALEFLTSAAELIRGETARIGELTSTIVSGYVILVATLLVVFATIARSVIVWIICSILVLLSLVTYLNPHLVGANVFLAGFILSLLIAIAGWLSFRRLTAVEADLEVLRGQITALETLETRRFMADLKSGDAPSGS